MYSVIFWDIDNEIRILENDNGSVWITETLAGADKRAVQLEKETRLEARTISLEGVED